jgi:glucose/arabinose dehydrogenase
LGAGGRSEAERRNTAEASVPNVNLIVGDDTSNTLLGTDGPDLIYGFNPDGPQGNVSSIAATRVAAGLSQPLFATAPPNDFGRLFIVEKTGAIKILNLGTGQVLATPFLDVTGQIYTDSESGLLGLAFDPDFAHNGFFYVDLVTNTNNQIRTEVRRYQVSASNPNLADPTSATTIITVDQPFGNHKGGWLGFGPEGDLYIALGDGGSGGDPFGNGQNIDSLLGKMLRIDVHGDDFPNDPLRNYRIPVDNPFVGTAGADEIWALGLRNPWRPSFDRGLNDLYIADVGQAKWEEIDIGQRGANYGWNVIEGPETFAGGNPSAGTLTAPIYYYSHSVGQSITGGYVYRGPNEGLQGQYFFGDFIAGTISTLHFNGTSWVATDRTSQIHPDVGTINNPSSFGEDALGNLYVVDFTGEVFRLTPTVTSNDVGDDLNGQGGDDMMFGGSGNDTLAGGTGNDTLNGGIGGDALMGGPENDTLVGGPGNDTVIGDIGNDMVVFTGQRSDYAITYNPATKTFTVADQRIGSPEGTDTVTGVEQFQFGDGPIDANALTAQTVTHPDNSKTVTIYDAISAFNWTSYVSDYDANNVLTTQTINESNGTHWVNAFDTVNAFAWSETTSKYDAGGNLMIQSGTNDNGTHWLTAHDTAGAFGWSEFTITFDPAWNITSATGLRDNATAMGTGEIGAAFDSITWYPQPFDPSHDLIPHI